MHNSSIPPNKENCVGKALKLLCTLDSKGPIIKTTESYRCKSNMVPSDIPGAHQASWKPLEKLGNVILSPGDIMDAYDDAREFIEPKGRFSSKPTPENDSVSSLLSNLCELGAIKEVKNKPDMPIMPNLVWSIRPKPGSDKSLAIADLRYQIHLEGPHLSSSYLTFHYCLRPINNLDRTYG